VTVAERLGEVRERVAAAAVRAGRDPGEVTIVAVSKAQPDDRILAARAAGQVAFGENRADELVDHAALLDAGARWHFVGRLQSNKARVVRPQVVALHAMDRRSLAEAWIKGPGSPPPVFVQVDLAGEAQKGGVAPTGAAELVEYCRSIGITVRGLMTLPPRDDDPRRWFEALAALRDGIEPRVGPLPDLSMGMSADFEAAIEAGSTVVRLGTTIFGDRSQR
jgi:hypothetical protein